MNFNPHTVALLVEAVELSKRKPREFGLTEYGWIPADPQYTEFRLRFMSVISSLFCLLGEDEVAALLRILGESPGTPLPAWMSPTIGEEQWPSEYFRVVSFRERFG